MIKNQQPKLYYDIAVCLLIIVPIITPHFIIGSARDHSSDGERERNIYSLPALTGCGGEIVSAIDGAKEQHVIELVNAERADRDLPPLKRNPDLVNAARYHAVDMGQDAYFKHDTYDWTSGSLELACKWSERISSYYSNWNRLGENIAAGTSDPLSVMDMWMNSEGHRDNILSPNYWEFGVGYATSDSGAGSYWVQDFGRQWNHYPVVINYEAASTDSADVSLFIYGQWDEIRIRNDNLVWSKWLSFQPKMNWQLPSYKGYHSVFVEMRSVEDSAASSDQIYLTTGDPTPIPGSDFLFLPLLAKHLDG